MKFLNGYKSFLGMIGLGVLGVAAAQGWIDPTQAATYGALVTTFTGISLKHSWDKKSK